MSFSIDISVRVSDLNYGNHLGYDKLIAILHQARLKCLNEKDLSEINIDGLGMIMKHLEVDYQGEAFFDDTLHVTVDFKQSKSAVLAQYNVTKGESRAPVAEAIETILFIDYETKKVKRIPKIFCDNFLSE